MAVNSYTKRANLPRLAPRKVIELAEHFLVFQPKLEALEAAKLVQNYRSIPSQKVRDWLFLEGYRLPELQFAHQKGIRSLLILLELFS